MEKLLRDGQLSFLGGMNSGLNPKLINDNQYFFGNNVCCRGGYCDQRQGFSQIGLTFSSDSQYEWFRDHQIQGRGDYYPTDYDPVVVVSVAGRIFSIYPKSSWSVQEMTPVRNVYLKQQFIAPATGSSIIINLNDTHGLVVGHPLTIGDAEYIIVQIVDGNFVNVSNTDDTPGTVHAVNEAIRALDSNPEYPPQVWMEQADKYFVIQDGVSVPIIMDFPITRRSLMDQFEVPVGRMMAYGLGRLWVAVNDKEYVAGDIVNGDSTVIKFTENTYLSEGGKFRVPIKSGSITGLKFIANLDTSLGQGPMLIFTNTDLIFSCNAPVNRDVWKSMTDPIQTVCMNGSGAEGQDGIVAVNSDLWYRSNLGIQSFILARRDYTSWGNSPVSSELEAIIGSNSESMLRFCSAIKFNNRLLMTVSPQPVGTGCYHLGIVALDFDPISTIGSKEALAYDGLWTGIKPVTIFTTKIDLEERAFAFARNEEGHNELWEILKQSDFDNEDGRIQSYIETRSYDCDQPFLMKKERWLELYVDKVKGNVDFVVHWKPDGYPCWYPWHSFTICQQYRTCSTDSTSCNTLSQKEEGFRTRLRLPEAPPLDEPMNDRKAWDHYAIQFRIQWTGRCRLTSLLTSSEAVADTDGNPTC